jgi:hypothetical protein
MAKFGWWKWIMGLSAFSLVVEFIFVYWDHYRGISSATESAAWGGEALTGLAAFLILIGFIYERFKSRSEAALEEVKFFLDDTGAIYEEQYELIKKRYPDKTPEEMLAILMPIPLIEEFDFTWLAAHAPEEAIIAQNRFQSDPQNREIFSKTRALLNHLEYLALHIKERGTLNEPALNAIKQGVVETVETYVLTMLTLILTSPEYYASLRWLYSKWYRSIRRLSLEERKTLVREALQAGKKARARDASSSQKNSEEH